MLETSQCLVQHPPEDLDFDKWQRLVNMMANLYNSASGVVVQYRNDEFNVVSTSDNDDNFLQVSSSWPWEIHSFCRRIMETRDKLYISDAINSDEWSCAPPVSDGPVRSYLGYPLFWPDGSLFGSFCVIDTKATSYTNALVEMLGQLKLIVESELKHVFDKQKIKSLLAEKIDIQEISKQAQEQKEIIRQALSLQESINTATLASLVDAVIRIDTNGIILSCNRATPDMFGFSTEELLGENIKILVDKKHAVNHDDYISRYNQAQNNTIIGKGRQVYARHKDGSVFPVQITVTEITVGTETQYIGLVSDVTEKVQNEELLKQLALYDSLTNCANRNLLTERFTYELSKANREQSTFSVAYLDLNKFKPVNDQYGHQAGDHVLITIAQRLRSAIRTHDLVARVGGDEFVVLFNNRVNAEHLKATLLSAINRPINFDNNILSVSASIGVATYPIDGTTLDSLLEIADERMYEDKRQHV